MFDVGLCWSTLSGVAASDAPSLAMLWLHNGSRLRVQARLSRIYIYINAANRPSCTAAEERKLLRSRLHHHTVVSVPALLCCCLH